MPSYNNDNKSVVLNVSLEKSKDYQLIFTGQHFKSSEGVAMKDYEINFTTAE
jgi:hypothetical protein